MVPLCMWDAPIALFEVGRQDAALSAREVARIEDAVEALAARIVVMGWPID